MSQSSHPDQRRAERFESFTVVDIFKYRWLPFQAYSAIILDLSTSGFRIEFTSPTTLEEGMTVYLKLPLLPFGILSPTHLLLKAECRWIDHKNYLMGGIFLEPKTVDQKLLKEAVAHLKMVKDREEAEGLVS